MQDKVMNTTHGVAGSDSSYPLRPRAVGLWLLVLTVLAAALRVIGINRGLWWDEIDFLLVSVRHPLVEIVTIFPGDIQHPLYAILARLSILTFGEHVWSLRLPALIFGVASIPMLYLLGASVTTRIEALVACRAPGGLVSSRLVFPECSWIYRARILGDVVDVFPAARNTDADAAALSFGTPWPPRWACTPT